MRTKKVVWLVITEQHDGRSSIDESVSEISLVTLSQDEAEDKAEELAKQHNLDYDEDSNIWWDGDEGMVIIRTEWHTLEV